LFPAVAACTVGPTPATGALEPRFVAVHNTLASMGLAQVGPLHQGTLAEGHETRAVLELTAGCATIVAIGGAGLRDLDAELLDRQGHPVAHDTTVEPQAVLKFCSDTAATFTLVVRATAGAGTWVAAAWQGAGSSPDARAPAQAAARQALGTCEAPIPLSAGTVSGSTARGEDGNSGTCERSDARELVYELDVTQRQRVVLDVEAHFDSVLYVRRDSCTDPDAEVDCNDDAPSAGRNHSHIESVLEPGRYFVFVDGYNQESGAFKLTVSTSDVLSLSDVCARAPSLLAGVPVSGTTRGRADDAEASCGGGAQGADAPYRLELRSRSRVRVMEHSDEQSPALHLRRACTDSQSEVACSESGTSAGDSSVTGLFDPGAYSVFVDGRERGASGAYSIMMESAPPEGTGIDGDGCGDALPLPTGVVSAGDTFAARDDVSGSCGGAGAADAVFHLDVVRRSRFVARFEAEEGPHLLVLFRHCGDRASEVACGKTLDEVLPPGTYFMAVDGASPEAFGRYRLSSTLRDLSMQGAACHSAPALALGRTLSTTSSGSGDRFAASCAGAGDSSATGADRVFEFSVAVRATVRLDVVAAGFDATLSIRRSCADSIGTEVACESDADSAHQLSIERTLEPGTYYALVDGQSPTDQGAFTLGYRIVTPKQ
jgi:hypothetical protein